MLSAKVLVLMLFCSVVVYQAEDIDSKGNSSIQEDTPPTSTEASGTFTRKDANGENTAFQQSIWNTTSRTPEDTENCTSRNKTSCSDFNSESSTLNNSERGPTNPFAGGLLSAAAYERLRLVFSYCAICIASLGFIGNILSLIVYVHMESSTTRSYLLSINVLDTIYIVLATPVSIAAVTIEDPTTNWWYLHYALYVSNLVVPSVRRIVICVTMMLSVERLLAIAFPFQARRMKLIQSPVVFTIIGFIVIFCLQLPQGLKYTIELVQNRKTEEISAEMVKTPFALNNEHAMSIMSYASSTLFVYTPLFLTILSNIWLVMVLMKHRRQRRKYADYFENQSAFFTQERQKAVVILVYTFAFVGLSLPYALNVVFTSVDIGFGPGKKNHFLFLGMLRVYSLLNVISSSMNFIVYFTMSASFRKHLRLIVSRKRHAAVTKTSTTSSTDIHSATPNKGALPARY